MKINPFRSFQGFVDNTSQNKSQKTESSQKTSSMTGKLKPEPCSATSVRNSMSLPFKEPNNLHGGLPPGLSSMVTEGSVKKTEETLGPRGINDSYTKLQPGNDEAKQIAIDNYRYAGLLQNRDESNKFRDASWQYTHINESKISKEKQPRIHAFINQLKDMGFEQGYLDLNGKKNEVFYNPRTGVAFHLAFDGENKELVIAFMGSGAENYLLTSVRFNLTVPFHRGLAVFVFRLNP